MSTNKEFPQFKTNIFRVAIHQICCLIKKGDDGAKELVKAQNNLATLVKLYDGSFEKLKIGSADEKYDFDSEDGENVTHFLVRNKMKFTLKLVINKIDINFRETETKLHILHKLAAENFDSEYVEYILSFDKIDVDAQDAKGVTVNGSNY